MTNNADSSRDAKKKLCTCCECGPEGKMIMPHLLRSHKEREKASAIDATQEAVVNASLLPILSEGSVPRSASPLAPERSKASRPSSKPIKSKSKSPPAKKNDTKNSKKAPKDPNRPRILKDIAHLEQCVDSIMAGLTAPTRLIFSTPPSSQSPPFEQASGFPSTLNHGAHALDSSSLENLSFLSAESQLFDIHLAVHPESRDSVISERREMILEKIEKTRLKMEEAKGAQWEKQRARSASLASDERGGPKILTIDTGYMFRSPFSDVHPLYMACNFLVLVLHLICGVSKSNCDFVLASLGVILQVAFTLAGVEQVPLLKGLPKDTRTSLDRFALDPVTTSYMFCPCCFKLYDDIAPLQSHCTHKETPTSKVCGTAMTATRTVKGKQFTYALRRYFSQDMAHWLGRLLARPGMEEIMDSAANRPLADSCSNCDDIWDAEMFRAFKGPDGKPFALSPDGEGRYIFGLATDGYNPYHNRTAGKKASSTGLYMVCFNLPPELRFQVENMFLVGIIPGPKPPRGHYYNHFLDLLVDQLLQFWNPGVHYSRTVLHPDGKLARCALIPLICDLIAGRQASGMAGIGRNECFCSFCGLDKREIENLDYRTWAPRSFEEHRACAEKWRDAPTEEEREELWDENGIRWTPLLRLPYWDPTKMVVLDSMHNLLLGLVRRHCVEVWGMSVNHPDGDGLEGPRWRAGKRMQEPSDKQKSAARIILEKGSPSKLRTLSKASLVWLCAEADLPYRGVCRELVDSLLKYRTEKKIYEKTSSQRLNKLLENACGAQVNQDDVAKAERCIARGDHKTLAALTVHTLAKCCEKANIPYEKPKARAASMLIEMYPSHLLGPVAAEPEPMEKATSKVPVVLGSGVLRRARNDMGNTDLPSWIGRTPKNIGTTLHGKPSADEWRNFFTVSLVITLIPIWSVKGDRFKKMLDNFMELVAAVKLAHSRSTSSELNDAYQSHMARYVEGLLELFPGHNLAPNHHLALHLKTLFESFGPVQAWRSFPFERLNGVFQRTPTNMRPGQMEQTVFQTFIRGSALRTLLHHEKFPKELRSLQEPFDKAFSGDIRGTLLNDILSSQKSTRVKFKPGHLQRLPTSLMSAFGSWAADFTVSNPPKSLKSVFVAKFDLKGVVFATHEENPKNSYVIFLEDTSGEPMAGRIKYAFTDPRNPESDNLLLAMECWMPLGRKHAKFDYYRQYPVGGGRLYYDSFEAELRIVPTSSVISHVARTPYECEKIGTPCVHILPLDRNLGQLTLFGMPRRR
ncbi:hypothetical protein BOTBODRAFT_181838 [Botryobasidium botryosum FD-172 SS1]|uniref:Uncharacterized protein n=1 Tax=Botryobasidium botryosum (strain FD-172 SS1) TaxID=930990 RepID=A0A067LSW5_BOTB1|nr:hypothetical protein BOTBODRAFT_181838 [Botryobasidium botryosum FD-172 SS1]